ncbi:caspase family protein [Alsobacter sp. KACC 23698]|uniref:Caspase family protein n=1 Tax=Alsobacter sp. KACC 23698 TaxID=3149229 RepID=A0AAU7JNK2_9HYPH
MKWSLSQCIGLIAALILALLSDSALAERRVALVIGNANYKKINRLENPVNDAPDISEALRKVGFEVIVKTDTDKGGFDRALSEFARKAAGSDAALFYYAGHGIQYQKQNYLLPVDIEVEDYNDVEFQAVNVTRVMTALERTTGVKIIILDACRDNPLDRMLSQSTRSAYGVTRGLARIDRTEGLVIAYATAPDQVAQDGSGRNSPFTEALIRRLAEPGLEIATLFRRVTQDVYERTNGRQRPEVSISLLSDYFLNLGDSDGLVWGRIRDSADPADFRTFMAKYPNSPFAREAQYRLDLFARIRREEDERVAREQEKARERERLQREALEQDRARLEAQRKVFERLEAEAAKEAARIAAERQEEARLENERVEAEKREASRKESERIIVQKRIDAERAAAARREADRVAAEDLARRQAEQREADRREVERIAAQKRIEADRLREAAAEAERQDALRAAEQQREAIRREVEQLAAKRRAEGERLARVTDAANDAGPAAAPDAGLSRQIGAALTDAERHEVERIAAEHRREQEAAAAEQRELQRLRAKRKLASGKEAKRLDAAIRALEAAAASRAAPDRNAATEQVR